MFRPEENEEHAHPYVHTNTKYKYTLNTRNGDRLYLISLCLDWTPDKRVYAC